MFSRIILILLFILVPGMALADCSDFPRAVEIRATCPALGYEAEECEMYILDQLGDCEAPDVVIPRYTEPEIPSCPEDFDLTVARCVAAGGQHDRCETRVRENWNACGNPELPSEPRDADRDPPTPRIGRCPDDPEEAVMMCMDQIGEYDRCVELVERAVAQCG